MTLSGVLAEKQQLVSTPHSVPCPPPRALAPVLRGQRPGPGCASPTLQNLRPDILPAPGLVTVFPLLLRGVFGAREGLPRGPQCSVHVLDGVPPAREPQPFPWDRECAWPFTPHEARTKACASFRPAAAVRPEAPGVCAVGHA